MNRTPIANTPIVGSLLAPRDRLRPILRAQAILSMIAAVLVTLALPKTTQAKVKSNTQVRLPDNSYLGDIDGDGNQDFVFVRRSGVLVTTTDSNMRRVLFSTLTSSAEISRLVIGDFAVSGREKGKDQICAIQTDNAFTCWSISDDKNGLWWWTSQTNFIGNDEEAIVGDFDGDTADDILVYKPSTGGLRMYTKDPNGGFGLMPNFVPGQLDAVDRVNKQFRAGEFGQATGRDDLLMFDPSSGQVSRFDSVSGDGVKTFWWAFTTGGGIAASANVDLAVANVDGDAHDDVVLRNKFDTVYRFFQLEYSAGGLVPIDIDKGQLPSCVSCPMYWLRNRGSLDAASRRDDQLLYVPSTRRWTSTNARMSGTQPTYWFAYGRGALSPVPGDVNGDRRADVMLLGNRTWGSIPIAMSNADGTFQLTNVGTPNFPQYAAQPGARFVQGDFDGDGLTDVAAIGGKLWASIPVAFSNGNGTYRQTNAPIQDFAQYATQAGVKVLSGDFDGDGRSDIALAGGPGWGSVPVALSYGDGTFRVVNIWLDTFPGLAATRGVKPVVADFNGDGKSDIALVGAAGWSAIPAALSNGDGTFSFVYEGSSDPAAQAWMNNFLGNATDPASQVVAGDFDGNGLSDIALVGGRYQGDAIALALNTGNNHFSVSAQTYIDSPAFAALARQPGARAVSGNFDDDGQADIALAGGIGWTGIPVAFASPASLSFRLANIAGPFDFQSQPRAQPVTTAMSNAGRAAPALDQNGDRRADIALAGAVSGGTVPVAFSKGNGTFEVTNNTVDAAFAHFAAQLGVTVIAGDFNGDAREDVALTSARMVAFVALARGDGTFQVVPSPNPPNPLDDLDARVVSGDFNGDGLTDIAAVGGGKLVAPQTATPSSDIAISYSNGDGTFHQLTYHDQRLAQIANDGASQVAAGDFNGDGVADLVTFANDKVHVFLSTGVSEWSQEAKFVYRSFDNMTLARSSAAPGRLRVGDFDGDGMVDLLMTGSPSSDVMRIGLSSGDGNFSAWDLPAPGFHDLSQVNFVKTVVGDFDGDGASDIALVGGMIDEHGHLRPGWSTVPVARSSRDFGGFAVTNLPAADFAGYASIRGATPAGEGSATSVDPNNPPTPSQSSEPPPPAPFVDLYIRNFRIDNGPYPVLVYKALTIYFDICNENDDGDLPQPPYTIVRGSYYYVQGDVMIEDYWALPPESGDWKHTSPIEPPPRSEADLDTRPPYRVAVPPHSCKTYAIFPFAGASHGIFTYEIHIGDVAPASDEPPDAVLTVDCLQDICTWERTM